MKDIKRLKTVCISEADLLIIAVIVHCILKTDTMYVNVPALIELKLQKFDKHFQLIVLEKEEFIDEVKDKDIQAFTEIIPHSNEAVHSIVVPSDVYDGACIGNFQDRMTLAHELAHCILHGILKIPVSELQDGEICSKYEDPEAVADMLARFLLSVCGLVQNMSTAELSAECSLSEQDAVSVQKEYKEGVAKILFSIKTVLFKHKISSKSAA